MKRRALFGTTLAGLPVTRASAESTKARTGDIPTTTLGRTGAQVQIFAQGGARMDLHPDIPSAAQYVRQVYELGLRYFDCARLYWCLRYALSQPGVQVAICGCGTVGQMEDNSRAVQGFRKMTPEESAAVRKRAVSGAGVYTGNTLEYWKKKA